jgi:small-conductance mechanosensitive channel
MAFIVFLMGWILAKVLSRVVFEMLNRMKFDHLAEKLNAKEFMEKANLIMTPAGLVSKFLYWLVMLLVFTTVSDMLGWTRVSIEISKLLSYLPNLFFAVVFFVIGTYIAQFIRNIITGATATLGISAGKIIGNIVFYFLFIIVIIASLDQAGMDTAIISSNLLLIIGTVLLSSGIAYGVASIEFVRNILAGFFTRKIYKVGQSIEIDGEKGRIMDITNVALTLQKPNGDLMLIPTSMLVRHKVTIFKT